MKEKLKFSSCNQTVVIDLSDNDVDTCLLFETHKGTTTLIRRFVDIDMLEEYITKLTVDIRNKIANKIENFSNIENQRGAVNELFLFDKNKFQKLINNIRNGDNCD